MSIWNTPSFGRVHVSLTLNEYHFLYIWMLDISLYCLCCMYISFISEIFWWNFFEGIELCMSWWQFCNWILNQYKDFKFLIWFLLFYFLSFLGNSLANCFFMYCIYHFGHGIVPLKVVVSDWLFFLSSGILLFIFQGPKCVLKHTYKINMLLKISNYLFNTSDDWFWEKKPVKQLSFKVSKVILHFCSLTHFKWVITVSKHHW